MNSHQAKVSSIKPFFAPEEYNSNNGLIPPSDFIVSRNLDGSALSRYGDLVWDRTPYSSQRNLGKLNFKFWKGDKPSRQQLNLVDEMHWLVFLLLWHRQGPSLNGSTLQNYMILLRNLANYGDLNGVSIKAILSDGNLLNHIVPIAQARVTAAILNLLTQLGKDSTGLEVAETETFLRLRKRVKEFKAAAKQTSPMPTRVYSHFLDRLNDKINYFTSIIDNLLGLYKEIATNPIKPTRHRRRVLLSTKAPMSIDTYVPLEFYALRKKYDLDSFWQAQGYKDNIVGVISAIIEIQVYASLQIQAFTGMRKNEVQSLPYDCLDVVFHDGDPRPHFVVHGTVTKLTNGKIKRVKWITSNRGRDAIHLAQKIASEVYGLNGNRVKEGLEDSNDLHLFVRPHFGVYGKTHQATKLNLDFFPEVRKCLLPNIEPEDIKELNFIDPNRDWGKEDKFQVGNMWAFTTHQLRRSLALYAHASGLVSLGALKRQLQHITEEMTLHYAKGSAGANDFISQNEGSSHISEEYRDTKPVSSYFAFLARLAMGKNDLIGGHGEFVKARYFNEQGMVILDRHETKKRFESGLMHYTETVLGACTNAEPCDINPISIIPLPCLQKNCQHLMGSKKSVEMVIQVKKDFVKKLKKGTVEYRIEMEELNTIETAFSKFK